MKGYKGFDKDLKCRDQQYKVGETVEVGGDISLCRKGLHFCEHPLDTFGYYAPSESRFAEVEAEGVSDEKSGDTKRVCKKLTVKAELSLPALVKVAVAWVFERADWSKKETQATGTRGAASATGYQGAASATGYQGAASATGTRGAASATGTRGAASATGDQGAASATGYQGTASATGDQGSASATGTQGAAVSLGLESKAKGAKGCWITIAEWREDKEGVWQRVNVKTARVDGEKIKADVWYQLKSGKFIEVK